MNAQPPLPLPNITVTVAGMNATKMAALIAQYPEGFIVTSRGVTVATVTPDPQATVSGP